METFGDKFAEAAWGKFIVLSFGATVYSINLLLLLEEMELQRVTCCISINPMNVTEGELIL